MLLLPSEESTAAPSTKLEFPCPSVTSGFCKSHLTATVWTTPWSLKVFTIYLFISRFSTNIMYAFLVSSSHPLSLSSSLICSPLLHVTYAVVHCFVICRMFCPLHQSQIFWYGTLCRETEVRKERRSRTNGWQWLLKKALNYKPQGRRDVGRLERRRSDQCRISGLS